MQILLDNPIRLKNLVDSFNKFRVGKRSLEACESTGKPAEVPLVRRLILDTEQVPHLIANHLEVAIDCADIA